MFQTIAIPVLKTGSNVFGIPDWQDDRNGTADKIFLNLFDKLGGQLNINEQDPQSILELN